MLLHYPIMACCQEDGYYSVEFPDFPDLNNPAVSCRYLLDVMEYATGQISSELFKLQKDGNFFPKPSKIADLDFGDRHPVAFYIPIETNELKEESYT